MAKQQNEIMKSNKINSIISIFIDCVSNKIFYYVYMHEHATMPYYAASFIIIIYILLLLIIYLTSNLNVHSNSKIVNAVLFSFSFVIIYLTTFKFQNLK